MSKFKIGDWVYTYDEQGLVYKHQVRDNAGFIYITGRPEPFDTKDIFKTKKECLQAMKDAGIQKASLHIATVMNLEKQISDLEAKLAESEEAIKYLKGIKRYDIGEMLTENTKLKQQLEEKEQQIETQKSNIEFLYDLFVSPQGEQTLKAINQDKISFAVEQLEKVKEYLTQELENVTELLDPLEYEDYHEFIGCGRGYKNSIEEIDNQIKQLKEGK